MATVAERSSSPLGEAMRLKLAGFVRTLRDNGFTVGLAETRDALSVLISPAAARASALKPALRALFSADRSDFQRFDEIFAAFWESRNIRTRLKSSGRGDDPKAASTSHRQRCFKGCRNAGQRRTVPGRGGLCSRREGAP